MPKTVLRLSDEAKYDFILTGIVSQKKDYRLCREINLKLDLELAKQEDYSVFNNKRMEDQAFSFYQYINEEEDQFNLISNRNATSLLLPEQKQIDYLFFVKLNSIRLTEEQIIASLKEIPLILGVYSL